MKRFWKRAIALMSIHLMLIFSATAAWAQESAETATAIELREMTVKSSALEWVLIIQGAALVLLITLVLNASVRGQIMSAFNNIRSSEKPID